MQRTLTRGLSLLTGLGLVFVGTRFLVAPQAGVEGFGVLLPAGSNYTLAYAVGVRDAFTGLLISTFVSLGYDRPLGWLLLLGAAIPAVDLAVLLAQPTAALGVALPHVVAIGLCLGLAASLFTLTRPAATTLQPSPFSPANAF